MNTVNSFYPSRFPDLMLTCKKYLTSESFYNVDKERICTRTHDMTNINNNDLSK